MSAGGKKKNNNVQKAKNNNNKNVNAPRPRNVRSARPLGSGPMRGLKPTPQHVQHHMLATHCPFDARAKGARTPSQYGSATNVHTSTVSYTLTSTAGGSIDAVVLPHPIYSVLGGYSTISGGVAATALGTGGVSTQPVRGNVSAANLSAAYTNYRVVSWGVRVKPLQSFTAAQGRLYVANIPTNPQLPALSGDGAGTTATVWSALGVPYDGTGVSDQLLNYPRSAHLNSAELVSEHGIELRPHFTGPGHEHFRESSILNEQGLVYSTALGVVSGTISLGYADVSGNSSIVIRGDGMTASTAVLLLEVIYHLEGTPKISSSAGAMVPATPQPPPTPDAGLHMSRVVASLSASPFVAYVSDKMKQEAVGFVKSTFGKEAGGLAEKVIGLGIKELPSLLGGAAMMFL